MFVLMHEVGHAVDDGYPDWQPFVDAINKDSCVPDEYGNTNKVEEFAQMFAMVSGGWFSGNIPADFSCLKNQFVRTLDILVNQGLMPFHRILYGTTGAFRKLWVRQHASNHASPPSICKLAMPGTSTDMPLTSTLVQRTEFRQVRQQLHQLAQQSQCHDPFGPQVALRGSPLPLIIGLIVYIYLHLTPAVAQNRYRV